VQTTAVAHHENNLLIAW